MSAPASKVSRPKWACPLCQSTHVQISLPTWYHETMDFNLEFIETDVEAQVMWWYCEDCEESESGEPINLYFE